MSDQQQKPAWKRYVPRIFRKDLARKLIALFLAGVIYYAVFDRLHTTHEIYGIQVPLTAPAGFVLIEKGIQTVRLTVAVNQNRSKTLKEKDFKVVNLEIKPENYVEGKPYDLQLTPSNFRAPLGVSVVSISPSYLSVDMEKLETKNLEVKADMDQKKLQSGYKVKETIVSPKEVRVTASSSRLKTLQSVKTAPIDLSSITKDFDITRKVVSPASGIKISPDEVLVQIKIERSFSEKTFKNLKIHIMQDSDKKIELNNKITADVTVQASSEVLEKLTRDDIKVFAFANNISEKGTSIVKLEAAISGNGIEVREIVPKTVKVTVK